MAALDPGETFGQVVSGPAPGVTLSRHAAGQTLPLHEHAQAYVCVVLSGTFAECDPRGEAVRRAGEVVVHPSGDRHGDVFGPQGALCLNLHLATDLDLPVARRAESGLARAVDELAAEVAKGMFGDRLGAEALGAEIVDRLSRTDADPDADCVARVLQALDDAPQADWSLTDLADLARRHPNHLARAFRARTGITLGAYRRRRRLTRLCLDLRLGRAPLAELALDHGYADQAHMSREFRAFAGMAPGAYRQAAR